MIINNDQAPASVSRWDKKDWLICFFLGIAAMLLYCVGRNREWQGDDDYVYTGGFSLITDAILKFDLSNLKGLYSSSVDLTTQILCAPRHASLPAFINAAFYAVCHGLRVPFSLDLLHVPIAVISTTSVLLLYGLLRRDGRINRLLCLAGAFLLLLSPLYVNMGRGLSTYFMGFVPFTGLLGLWGLYALSWGNSNRLWVGIALSQVILSDIIWFVTLPVLIGAYVWSSSDRKQAVIRLLSWKVLGPLVLTACLLLLGTWMAYHRGLSTPLLKTLLTDHGAKVGHGSPIIMSPAFLADCLSLQMGVALPLVLLLGVVVWWIDGRRMMPGLITAFGLTGSLIYGCLFYMLTPERNYVRVGYQLYILLPLVGLVIALVSVIQRRFRRGPVMAACVMSVLLFFESLGCVNYIWKIPVSPFSGFFSSWHHGTFAPNQGTKAAGYLARRWIEAVWRWNPNQPITVGVGRYSTSFIVFSGINSSENENGAVFVPEFGRNRSLSVFSSEALFSIPVSSGNKAASFVCLIDLTGTLAQDADTTTLAQFLSRSLRYEIRSSSPRNGMAVVYVLVPDGLATPPIPPGEISMEQYETQYDRQYNRYSDFFPRHLVLNSRR